MAEPFRRPPARLLTMIQQWSLESTETIVKLPVGTKFLCVKELRGRLYVWTDDRRDARQQRPSVRRFEHRICMVPTGDHAPQGGDYIGSVERHHVMWHVYVVAEHGYIDGLMQEYANNALISNEALIRDQEGVFS